METTIVTSENFDEVIKSDIPVLIDFWADWCGPCRFMSGVIDEMARNYQGKLLVCKCDAGSDEAVDIVERLKIKNLPTLMFYKNGEMVKMLSGAVPTKDIEYTIKQTIGIAYESAQIK